MFIRPVLPASFIFKPESTPTLRGGPWGPQREKMVRKSLGPEVKAPGAYSPPGHPKTAPWTPPLDTPGPKSVPPPLKRLATRD